MKSRRTIMVLFRFSFLFVLYFCYIWKSWWINSEFFSEPSLINFNLNSLISFTIWLVWLNTFTGCVQSNKIYWQKRCPTLSDLNRLPWHGTIKMNKISKKITPKYHFSIPHSFPFLFSCSLYLFLHYKLKLKTIQATKTATLLHYFLYIAWRVNLGERYSKKTVVLNISHL